MVSIGTLMAFAIVCAAVLILRVTNPDVHRPFRCPCVYVVAPLGIAVTVWMMMSLPGETWLRLVIWLAIGLIVYLLFGHHDSALRGPAPRAPGPSA